MVEHQHSLPRIYPKKPYRHRVYGVASIACLIGAGYAGDIGMSKLALTSLLSGFVLMAAAVFSIHTIPNG